MDARLLEAIRANDTTTMISLFQANEGILEQKTADSMDTALHLASKLGHVDIASEIVKLCPDMATAENKMLETPIYNACRRGSAEVLKVLLEADPRAACKLNSENKSPLFMACSHGNFDVVNLLLNHSGVLLGLEETHAFDRTCIHVAASRGHVDVVRELVNMCPDFLQTIDENGNSPLHHACIHGHRDIARMLVRRDTSLALQYNNNGYTPLHMASMKGKVSVLEEFVLMAPESFHYATNEGETIFHLAVRYGQYQALVFLVNAYNGSNLIHRQDQYGNTILHLAVSGGRHQIAEYLVNKTKVEINVRTCKGFTALDILDQTKNSSETKHLEAQLVKAGGRRSNDIQPPIISKNSSWPACMGDELNISNIMNDKGSPRFTKGSNSRTPSPRPRENVGEVYSRHRNKKQKIHMEALQNARNTITLVAILIATVTFSAGINPPGGVDQEGKMKGKSPAGRSTAFKVFAISNNIALFTSLSIVVVLVSIIPFRRKAQMRLLMVAHKVMWVSVAFMATAYVAATWVVVPHSQGSDWLFVTLLAVSSGSLGLIFIGLGVMLVEHWLRKMKWRKLRKNGRAGIADPDLESQNSDVESSYMQGYHSY